jgi:hypothetical protein
MKIFLILFLIFFVYFSFCGSTKSTYTYQDGTKKEKDAGFFTSLFIVIGLAILSSFVIAMFVLAFCGFLTLLF